MGQSDSVNPRSASLPVEPDQFRPVDSSTIPRFAGPAMRLPVIADPSAVDIAMFGIPWDGGTTNRPGARHGPRQVREMSGMIRRVHGVTRVSPYDLCRVADLGDAPTNPIDLQRTGTPEFGGLQPREVNRLLRGLRGVQLVGADVVEVSPPFDATGGTAVAAAHIAFEMVCLMSEVFTAQHR